MFSIHYGDPSSFSLFLLFCPSLVLTSLEWEEIQNNREVGLKIVSIAMLIYSKETGWYTGFAFQCDMSEFAIHCSP